MRTVFANTFSKKTIAAVGVMMSMDLTDMKFQEMEISVVENGFVVRTKQSGRKNLFETTVYEFGSEADMVRFIANCVQACTTEVEYDDDGTSE